MKEQTLPNLIIAGVNKAGTTSLFAYLSKHPQVGCSSIKETCYFLPKRYYEPMQPVSEYEALFKGAEACPVVMEATPGYFYGGKKLIREVGSLLPDTKIILILRDPADRLLSFFYFMKSMLLIDESMTLENYVTRCKSLDRAALSQRDNNPFFGVEGGYYHQYIDSWVEFFGDRIKILFFEDLKQNPEAMLMSLSHWLDIDASYYQGFNFSVENKTAQYKQKWLHFLAIHANKHFEVFFRRHPSVKSRVKKIYGYFNLESKTKQARQAEKLFAESLYLESNRELRVKLKSLGLKKLPGWLEHV